MKKALLSRKTGVVIMYIAVAIIAIPAAILLYLVANSSGKPKAYVDKEGRILPNSISEKSYIDVNGSKLGFFIKGKSRDNPVLLYLHGGMPDYFLTQKYPTGLDDVFTVVWWDQRGSGISYDARFKDRKMELDDVISDAKRITDYLRSRFSQEKIYLMAHSGGSFLGIKVISRYPELYKAYIGVAQISYQKLSEKKAYDYIIEQYRGNRSRRSIVTRLQENPVKLTEPLPREYVRIRDYAMHDLGIGTMHTMKNVVTGIFIPSLLFTEYSMKDKVGLWKGKADAGISAMWKEIDTHNLKEENTVFKMPIYIFHGAMDYTCSYELSKEYFESIQAPKKRFYTFNESAHSPIFEEPGKCIKIIKEDVLQ